MGAVSEAVATQAHQPPAQVSPEQMVKDVIARQAAAFTDILPDGVDAARWSRIVMTSVRAKPKLVTAFQTNNGRTSILLSAMMAASLGLEPDTPTQECSLQPRNVKRDGQWYEECELNIGYRGYAKLARNSGDVAGIVTGVVRVGDDFHYARGVDVDEFRHVEQSDEGDELTHAYAIVRFTTGPSAWVVLTRRQIEKRRAESESWKKENARPYSPWTKWPEEMWRKTALRYLLTHGEVPLSPEVARAAHVDEVPLEAKGTTIAALPRDARPAGELGAGEAGDREEPDVTAGVPSPVEDVRPSPAPPAPQAPMSDRDIAKLAGQAFPCTDAPRGTKTQLQKRLRYALAYACTGRKRWHLTDLTPEDRSRLVARLGDIIEGRATFAADDQGVAFVAGSDEVEVLWSAFEDIDNATPADESPAGSDPGAGPIDAEVIEEPSDG